MLHQIKASCPAACRNTLTAVLERAHDEGPRRYFCHWRVRSVPPGDENPSWPPDMYATLSECPSCGCYLPDFVELREDGNHHFYGLSADELMDRWTGAIPAGP